MVFEGGGSYVAITVQPGEQTTLMPTHQQWPVFASAEAAVVYDLCCDV